VNVTFEILEDSPNYACIMRVVGQALREGCSVEQTVVRKENGRLMDRIEIREKGHGDG
jgi:hypothetical protein